MTGRVLRRRAGPEIKRRAILDFRPFIIYKNE